MRYLDFARGQTIESGDSRPGAEAVTIVDHIVPIAPSVLQPHSSYLTCVEFYGPTLLCNIQTTLITCPNLKELSLTHIFIDEYRPYWRQPDFKNVNITAAKLQSIECNRSGLLSKDETILLDFFCHVVTLPALKNLTFGRMTYGYSPRNKFFNEVVELYGKTQTCDSLARFLAKSAQSVRTFSIRRHQFTFIDDDQVTTEILQAVSKLKLKKLRFQCDTAGIHYLLQALNYVERIDCMTHFQGAKLSISGFCNLQRALADCVLKNADILTSFRAIGIIEFPLEQMELFSTSFDNEIFDFSTFKDCLSLTELQLMKAANYTDTPRAYHPGFTIKNSHLLPESIVDIELWLGHIDLDELCKVTLRMRDLVNLKDFRLHTLVNYRIPQQCFRNIVSVEDCWAKIYFYNGTLDGDFYPQTILAELNSLRVSTRIWEVRMCENSCEFVSRENVDLMLET